MILNIKKLSYLFTFMSEEKVRNRARHMRIEINKPQLLDLLSSLKSSHEKFFISKRNH